MKSKIFLILFAIAVIGVFSGIALHEKWLDYIFKPLIMISLGGHFLMNSVKFESRIRIFGVLAILFSLLGDTFLMFTGNGPNFFIFGLGSFLVAQIGYIFLFRRLNQVEGLKPFLVTKPLWLLLYIFYGGVIYILLFPNLDLVLKIAVFIYMSALLGMSVMALNRKGILPQISFNFVFSGSLLFVVSDTLIALDKFLTPIPADRLWVMSTYMVAQFLIVTGILKQSGKQSVCER
ncbi:MAG: lysoplasmalogenase [Draconibacterium sp.]|jgi:uncharacterized membrane protein YhhN